MTAPTLWPALLHDTVEDTDYSLDQLRDDFGDEIALLVDGVTKLDKVEYGQAARLRPSARWWWRWPATSGCWSSNSADRLHNMRTLAVPAGRQAADQGARDPGDLCPTGPPPGYEHDQVGAGGPLIRHALPEDVRRDRAPGRTAGTEPRQVPRRCHSRRRAGPAGTRRSRRWSPAAPSTTTPSIRR